MGNLGSASSRQHQEDDIWWTNGQRDISNPADDEIVTQTANFAAQTSRDISLNQLSDKRRQELDDFKFEMERKHEKRREILAAKKKQFDDLREEVRRLTQENETLKQDKSQEALTKEIEQLHEENEHMRLLLSTKQSGGVLMEELEKVIRENTTLRSELKGKVEELNRAATLLEKNRELRISIAEMQQELQSLNGVVVEFEKEREEYKAHVVALKDVINVSKKMLLIRESQLKELREKVESIEESLSGKEMNILSHDLRMEYERQLQSIRNLRTLYEERQRSDHREKEELKKLVDETRKELEIEQNKNKEAEERISELEELNSQKYDQIKSLESNLGLTKAESRQFQAELAVINQLFSEVLLGFNSSQEIDLDTLTKHLEDNHALLQNIVSNELSSQACSALPKVLLDLVHQVHSEEEKKQVSEETYRDESGRLETIIEESESQTSTDQINSVEEIVQLLPKVWRVLIELLSQHKVPVNVIHEDTTNDNPCYKTVQTPKGPSLVLSVSQTFIRLKDLILEKKSLEKETGHLKQLNTHLENRLQDQEKRLETVSNELNKTWHVVGKLQKEHQLLHTQEKILRYELAQKRKLLTTLREELEYSREKWQEAREKNSKTEKQWKQLRVEFASRRNTLTSDDFNNSQESGYSDERCSSSDDEPGYETDVSECAPKQTEDLAEESAARDETKFKSKPTEDLVEEASMVVNTESTLHTPTPLEEESILNHPNQTEDLTREGVMLEDVEYCLTPLEEQPTLNIPNQSEGVVMPADKEPMSLVEDLHTHTPLEKQQTSHDPNRTTPSTNEKSGDTLNPEDVSSTKEIASSLVASVIEEAIASILQSEKTENETTIEEPVASTSIESKKKTLEELLAAKEERLKRLEGQCGRLMEQVSSTTQKSVMISNKLDDLHEVYGERSAERSTVDKSKNDGNKE